MKLIIQNTRVAGTATDDYAGPEEFITAPDEYNNDYIDYYKVVDGILSFKVPHSVSMRQANLILLEANLLDDIESIVATLPRKYQLEWTRASDVYRDNPLVEMIRIQKEMTPEQIDILFIAAKRL